MKRERRVDNEIHREAVPPSADRNSQAMAFRRSSGSTRQIYLGLLLGVAGIVALAAYATDLCAAGDRPNIVFILTDDQGYGDAGCHGNPILKTPNIDKLRSQSVRFTDFSVSPSCSPTRCALMTGMHEFKSGVTHTIYGRDRMSRESTTIAEALKKAGYRTGLFGKWHLGHGKGYEPHERGFDVAMNVRHDSQISHFRPQLIVNGNGIRKEGYRTDVLFDEAMKFIETNKDGPFFCYLATYSPHWPLKCPEEYWKPYEGKCGGGTRVFFGMIANIDYNLSRLMEHLDKLQLSDNTVLVFMNDNGATMGTNVWNAGMRGTKGTTWRGGVRAISFWRWPGTFKTADVDDMAAHIDVFPTFMELAGAKAPPELTKKLDGMSLVPLLTGKGRSDKYNNRYIVTHLGRWMAPANPDHHKHTHAAVRWKKYNMVAFNGDGGCKEKCCARLQGPNPPSRWKYSPGKTHIHLKRTKAWELYDLSSDPGEENNIAGDQPALMKEMRTAYDRWWNEVRPLMINEQTVEE